MISVEIEIILNTKFFFLMQIVNCKEISEDTAAKKKKKKRQTYNGKNFWELNNMHAKVQNLVYKMNNRKSRTESNMFYMEDKGDNISQNVGYNLEMKSIKVS